MRPLVKLVDQLPELDRRILNPASDHRGSAELGTDEIRRQPLDVIASLDSTHSPIQGFRAITGSDDYGVS